MPALVRGTLVCTKCGQTKNFSLPKGVTPDMDADWHKCDPQNVHSPERQMSNEVLRAMSFLSGKPLTIGGLSAEESAYNDVEKKSTKIII